MGKLYWRSIDEFADTPEFREFVEREFPNYAPELLVGPTRRQFLKVMGASLALAGLTGCRWPKENILPASRQRAGFTPGLPVSYASAFELGGVATGLLVTSYDGRPVKIEGNPDHPFSRGATDALAQAAILEMYCPDRSTQPASGRTNKTWDEFLTFANAHFADVRSRQGSGFCILSEATASPSVLDLRARMAKSLPQARWFEYEPVSNDNERVGLTQAFGRPLRSVLALDKADVIVCLDADLLLTHPASVRYARDWAATRRAETRGLSRMYAFESLHSLTGTNADVRRPVRSIDIPIVAARLAVELAQAGVNLPAAISGAAAGWRDATGKAPCGGEIAKLAAELAAARGKCVIAAGLRQPPEVHALVAALNEALGNVGATVSYVPDAVRPTHAEAIRELCTAMDDGRVDTLLILGGNPAYSAPADLDFAGKLAKVKTSIHLSLYRDETSEACTWHVPRAHFLESWGDVRAWDGTVSIVQPLIAPLYDGRSPLEMLALALGHTPAGGYEIVRATFQARFTPPGVPFEQAWERAVHDGVVANTRYAEEKPNLSAGAFAAALTDAAGKWVPVGPAGKTREVELVFAPDHKVYDGRFANNGWLQELPDPVTKLTWDNAALVSVADGRALGLERSGDKITLRVGERTLRVPAYLLPGHASGSVTLLLGYGRRRAGRVGDGVGVDVNALRTSEVGSIVAAATISAAGGFHRLVTTQDHHAMESKIGNRRAQELYNVFARELTLEEYKHDPKHAQHVVHLPQLTQLFDDPKQYKINRWGMAIDLTACTGCSSCVIACQAENNIPVVGREEVGRGREMHWIRIDRYFKGDPADPGVAAVHQPVPCMHCENAPCEQVCPVAATTHDDEGLNVMVYNRCVGTRYCSNNCPYKVRRFNWFYNHHGPKSPRGRTDLTDIEKMMFNPEVTVRSRGVMEKCTFCVQRIKAVVVRAKNEHWPLNPASLEKAPLIPDGSIIPACAQACPTEAITFGDLMLPGGSKVRRMHDHDRAYGLLEEYNTRPRTKYLARLRNPLEPHLHGPDDHPAEKPAQEHA